MKTRIFNVIFIISCILTVWLFSVPMYFNLPISGDFVGNWLMIKDILINKTSPFDFMQTPGYGFGISFFWMNLIVGFFTDNLGFSVFVYIKFLTEITTMILCGVYFVHTISKHFFKRNAAKSEIFLAVLIPCLLTLLPQHQDTSLFFINSALSYSADFFFVLLFLCPVLKLLFIPNYQLQKQDYAIFILLFYTAFTNLSIYLFFFLPTLVILILYFNLPKARKLMLFFILVILIAPVIREIINVLSADNYFILNPSRMLVMLSHYPIFIKTLSSNSIMLLVLAFFVHLISFYFLYFLTKRFILILRKNYKINITPLEFILSLSSISFFTSFAGQTLTANFLIFLARYFDVPLVMFFASFLFFTLRRNFGVRLWYFIVFLLIVSFVDAKKFRNQIQFLDYHLYLDKSALEHNPEFIRFDNLSKCLAENTQKYNLKVGMGEFHFSRPLTFVSDFYPKRNVKVKNFQGMYPSNFNPLRLSHYYWANSIFQFKDNTYNYIVVYPPEYDMVDSDIARELFDKQFFCDIFKIYVISKEKNIKLFNKLLDNKQEIVLNNYKGKFYKKRGLVSSHIPYYSFINMEEFIVKNDLSVTTIVNKTPTGTITFGPYYKLYKGKYKINIEYKINNLTTEGKNPLSILITKNGGELIERIELESRQAGIVQTHQINFEVKERRIRGFELVTQLNDNSGSFTLYNMTIEKI